MCVDLGHILINIEDSNMEASWATNEMDSKIWGYHVYVKSENPEVGEVLSTDHEQNNEEDKFAVAVFEQFGVAKMKIVGHLPIQLHRIEA